jgi:hypothetical protein
LRVAFLGAQPFSKKRNFATATLKCFEDGSEAFPYWPESFEMFRKKTPATGEDCGREAPKSYL